MSKLPAPTPSSYNFRPLQPNHLEQILEFSCKYFYEHDPILKRISTVEEYRSNFRPILRYGCESGFSIGVWIEDGNGDGGRDGGQGELIGFATSIGYLKYMEVLGLWCKDQYLAISLALQSMYHPKNPKKTAHNCIGAVKPEYQNKGISWMIALQIQKQGLKKGYNEFIVDLNYPTILNKMIKIGYRVVAKIGYKDFQYEGKFPFCYDIRSSDSYCLISKIYEEQKKQEQVSLKDRKLKPSL